MYFSLVLTIFSSIVKPIDFVNFTSKVFNFENVKNFIYLVLEKIKNVEPNDDWIIYTY